jgi:hypothetical protein
MIELLGRSKAEAGALALATEQLEYVRSLPYDSVGTVGGIPNGLIPQNATTTLNGIAYNQRIVVEYVDAPEDGIGASDSNAILADYKRVKVEYSWSNKGAPQSMSLISNIVPRGIETTAGGGTLRVNVFDSTVQPVAGAAVHVYNDTTTTTVDTIRYTNVDGVALFSGAPAAANYQITVTDAGYSTDQTYSSSSTNPNPITPHVAVLQSEVSTMNFQIDALSDLMVKTIGSPTTEEYTDTFSDASDIATSTTIVVGGGSVVLSGGVGSYAASGELFSTSTIPSPISSWSLARLSASTSVDTDIRMHVYEVAGGVYTLIPDGVLSGNSSGFSSGPVDISSIDPVTYPTLALGGVLTSTNVNETPELFSWGIEHVVSEPPIPNISYTLTSNKTIGTTASATPVYKYQDTHVTDGNGESQLIDMEWDIYDVAINTGGYMVKEACSGIPFILGAGTTDTLTLTLAAATTASLRVIIENGSGDPIPDATVDLSRTGFSDSEDTSACGQAYFPAGLSEATDYQLDVSAAGYTNNTVTDVVISEGSNVTTVILSAS